MDTRSYYDDFADWYERGRDEGYHKMLDDLELDLVRRYGTDRDILEAGCGTGLLLERCDFARSAVGIDLSQGMLVKARERSLEVAQASILDLPFADESFDLVYSVKVLPHVERIERALQEMARVTRPGGYVLAEFYNSFSLRYAIKQLKAPTAISTSTSDDAVYTRYDYKAQIRRYLPPELAWVESHGIRVVTPVAQAHELPLIGSALRAAEKRLRSTRVGRTLGGFLVVVLRRL